jgi:hypothetical protein
MSKNMQEGLLNRELTESDQILIIKTFLNDGYGSLINNKELINKYGATFFKNKDVKNLLKSARFNKYFEKRLKNAINALNNLENMSNTNNYYFSRKEVQKQLGQLRSAHTKVQNSFKTAFDKFEKQERETVEGKYSDDLDPKELLKLYRETKDKNTEQGFKR